ncbi:MAG TPA: hypothetical protein VI588_02330 [Candidatus Gracilibacteria bacterium]|nr:hypothetical protein [Candidatus Gracilibacteria bacterium]
MNIVLVITFIIQVLSIAFFGLYVVHFFDFSSKYGIRKVSEIGRSRGLHLQHIMIGYAFFVLVYLAGSIALVIYLSSR